MKLKGGYIGFTLFVCLSARPSVHNMVYALYLQQCLPDPVKIYISYQATSVGVSSVFFFQNSKIAIFGKFFKFVTLTLSRFELGSNMKIVWIWGGRGYPQNAGILVILVWVAFEESVTDGDEKLMMPIKSKSETNLWNAIDYIVSHGRAGGNGAFLWSDWDLLIGPWMIRMKF